ncbi:PREDICTED: probable inactive tRNA-specific adenosine deaminase-like protein 3 [Habropoda laboriosa]|uniref:probable inactive tRNA-specific adenosine deaminase-like protein 3 n=1 Tax=Habropoda laboriosa TaxID=597456 RepID=UPI00083CED73|nr:PREDICTED: probable inactive tRNA-specific adenosine deaminase-like protein 3 [Habropoda laboriosa]
MAVTSPKNVKESKVENADRSWIARPILSSEFTDDPTLEDVYVGLLKQKKDISRAIKSISAVLPGFRHLKRCSSNKLLLTPVNTRELAKEDSSVEYTLTEERLKEVLNERGFNLSLLEENFQILRVPSRAARTKVQAARSSKIWPVNFHPDPSIERLIDGSVFTEHQLDTIGRYMRVAVDAARLEAVGDSNCNGSAVIVDPEDGRILAVAASRIDQHPMWHAATLAVDLVAKLQGGGAWKLDGNTVESDSSGKREIEDYATGEGTVKRKYVEEAPLYYPKSLSKINLPKEEPLVPTVARKGRNKDGSTKMCEQTDKCGPYLCTGYWAFSSKEPCPLCAMALLHSRVSRIFYGVPNENTGVLGSRTILHAVPGLNHRYQVWSGVLEQECRQVLREIESRNID